MSRRICFVLPKHWSALMGGSQYQAKVLIEHLLAEYDVEIHFLTAAADAGHEPRGYGIVRVSSGDGVRRYGHFVDGMALYRALARVRPDVVYQQVGCGYTGIAAFYARRAGIPMVWRVSSDRSVRPLKVRWWRIHRWIEQRLLEYGIRRADIVLAQTQSQKAELAAHYGRSDAIVLPNFHPYPDAPTAARDSAPRRVVWIANLKPLKNPAAFVRLALALAPREDVEFVMVGAAMQPGPWNDELMRLVASAPNLRYVGPLSQDEVNDLLERAHVLVNTSDYEGFSNTFIQAWMRRVPVVSLRVDPDSLLSGEGLGFLSHDEAGLSRDVERLLDEPGLRERIAERCHDYAVRNHSVANIEVLARLLRLERKAVAKSAADLRRSERGDCQSPLLAAERS